MGLRLPGRGEKIHEMVCRCGGLVPIREVWRARRTTATIRTDLGVSGTLGTCASNASNETRRSCSKERDHWKRRSEHLEKELEAARRAGRRQAAPFAKDRPQGRGGRPGPAAGPTLERGQLDTVIAARHPVPGGHRGGGAIDARRGRAAAWSPKRRTAEGGSRGTSSRGVPTPVPRLDRRPDARPTSRPGASRQRDRPGRGATRRPRSTHPESS